jgi:hypothetical protein
MNDTENMNVPSMNVPLPNSETKLPGSVQVTPVPVHATMASDLEPLPPGWTEVKHQGIDRPYYINQSTNESTWVKPALTPGFAVPIPPALTTVPNATVIPINTILESETNTPKGNTSQPVSGSSSGNACASLAFGILGIFFFGWLFGPIAICLGKRAQSEMEDHPEAVEGTCQAQAGIALGWIDIILWVIIVIIFIAA